MADPLTPIHLPDPGPAQPQPSSADRLTVHAARVNAPHRPAEAGPLPSHEIIVDAGMWTVFNRRLLKWVDQHTR
jgi:hypothetical protein